MAARRDGGADNRFRDYIERLDIISKTQIHSALATRLVDDLAIDYPIVLAGMGTASGPALVAAVSNAGGMGVLGGARVTAQRLDEWITETKQLTSKPFGVDTLLPSSIPDQASVEQLSAEIPEEYFIAANDFAKAYGLGALGESSFIPTLDRTQCEEQLEVVMDHRVPLYVAGLGSPAAYIEKFHSIGTKVFGIVGNVRQAKSIAAAGVDGVVAQGTEAGGHNSRIATMALLPQVVDAVGPELPVLGAGGIGDGRGIVAALALGAQAVWMGTRFVVTKESMVPEYQKRAILSASEEDTVVTRYRTGKPVRMLKTILHDFFEERGLAPLPLPHQRFIAGPILERAEELENGAVEPGAAGQIAGMLTTIQPAEEVIKQLIAEASTVLDQFQGQRPAAEQGR